MAVLQKECIFATELNLPREYEPNSTMNKSLFCFIVLFLTPFLKGHAQEWMKIYHEAQSTHWMLPIAVDSIDFATISAGQTQLLTRLNDATEISFSLETIDSLGFYSAPEATEKDKYQTFQMFVFTQGGQAINTKDYYIPCYIGLNGRDSYANRWLHAGIRGRGNSTWEWYAKKPYRIKLDEKEKMLGIDKAKSWVLLANYRDVTDMMNTYVFELGRMMGLPYTNHTRYVELFVNGNYVGVYQLTEQIQQNKNRVNVSDERGILLTLDVDDGPAEASSATNNFWTKGYAMPAAVKYPDDELLTPERRDSIRDVFAQLETAIKDRNYAAAASLLDMESFARYVLIQEFFYNVELSAPRSVFIHKDGDGPWVMGPLWDADAGFDFDWTNMKTGHTFFANYRETVMGSNPVRRNGNYSYVPAFFTDLFGTKEFVELYKKTWRMYADSIVSRPWQEVEAYAEGLRRGAMRRESRTWAISGKSFETELAKMKTWLENRRTFMDNLIENIPVPEEVKPIDDEQLCGTIDVNTTMQRSAGYTQNVHVEVSKSEVCNLLGIKESEFSENSLVAIVPLNTDGSEGANNTDGVYGGWFNGDNNPRVWDGGHVFIEVFSDLFSWNCGIRNDTCFDDEHTVTMQYQYQVGSTLKKVNVRVHFSINRGWW